mmetsp:Transcript_25165/g.25370  ORF Transcript_25165/g.25370 Transcript_25165/m.25370 type:complete len:279 (-) Transcript_25165:242-1078(-)|eukprot:CAMPEP_0182429280 /NCGR_PEP_ID=MMETSP1167-20130531/25649_1 /TAXON_ID=2988 /ORGANISM="Mallomonas Sp, Strain CCMP3275" /LENGTH=278 /DNA_ID=CAMNT_0024612701 /DNA_START=67 /DNA_END=903 /DNA_ORIENTATION=+
MDEDDSPPLTGYTGHAFTDREATAISLSTKRPMRRYEEFKAASPLRGYTGHLPRPERYQPGRDDRIVKIRGYSGYIEGSRNVYGTPIIPHEEEQLAKIESKTSLMKARRAGNRSNSAASHASAKFQQSFEQDEDEVDPDVDLQEKYIAAMEQLWTRGQTPQMLLRMVQGKVSERVTDYSSELIRVRKLFESFDLSGRGWMDVPAFRQCMELMGCQLDEIQSMALFAFFDDNNDGKVSWKELADNVVMYNPGGGKVVPKQITATMFSEDWNSLGQKIYI